MQIKKETLAFLADLESNNYRPWFQENKDRYDAAYANAKEFLEVLKTKMNEHDVIGKSKIYRVYRDVRFSKDKTPYNTDLRFSLGRDGVSRRGGYFLRITPTESYVACGFWKPESSDLKLIRNHITAEDKPLRKILKSKEFVDTFGSLEGEQVKTAPKGFDKEHPAIDLLKYKQYIVSKKYKKSESTKSDFIDKVITDYRAIRPYFDYMSELLTHDLNGIPLYEK